MTNKNSIIPMSLYDERELKQWAVVNDNVMGGVSTSTVSATKNTMVFSGRLSLENNGGFASVRRFGDPIKLTDTASLKLKVIGDGRTYQLRLRTHWQFDSIAYASEFETEAGKEQTLSFNPQDFVAVWRGRLVQDAPELKFEDVLQPGFMLADKTPGEFELHVISLFQQTLIYRTM